MTVAERTDTLHNLLRGERAIAEAYEQALRKVGLKPGALELRRIADDHRDSVTMLRQYILRFGGAPDPRPADVGRWAEAVMDAPGLHGDTGLCKALREGEAHGLKEYEDALQDPYLHPDCRAMIRFTLLPRQRDHIRTLDGLMNTAQGVCG